MNAPLIDEISEQLPLGVHAVGAARQFVGSTIGAWGAGTEDISAAELLASELVTNALLYGYGARTATLQHDGARLRILISDSAPGVPMRRDTAHDDEVGHGMQLIEAYAESWGVEPRPDGKVVWCEIVISGH